MNQWSESFRNFVDKPLGTYVALAILLSSCELGCCLYALTQQDALAACVLKADLGKQVGISNWLYAQMGMAWLNLIFAPYIQFQLWQKLQEEAQEQGAQAQGPVPVTTRRVKDSFQHVFLHDIGVCLYVFALAGSFVWSCLGSQWLTHVPICDPEGYASYAAWIGIMFFWFVVLYSVTWFCYMECVSAPTTSCPTRQPPGSTRRPA